MGRKVESAPRPLRVFYEKAICVKGNVVPSPAAGRHTPRTTLLSALCGAQPCMAPVQVGVR